MVINTNIHAMEAATRLSSSTDMLAKSLARLSSGSKIVNPSDDAAGLAVASRLDAQVLRTVETFDASGAWQRDGARFDLPCLGSMYGVATMG